ncbi:MAG: 16S rRNA (cytidine(1402)-2'-O)-methyltransferase [Pseudomonadales bacterium]
MSKLYVVATPIGNLSDITLRAIDVLKEVDLVAAEDTRHSGALLAHLGIDTPMQSYHDRNEDTSAEQIVDKIRAGISVALISDAGTPLISDPGYRLVCRALEEGIAVVPIPGVSAVIAALSVSGLPTNRFAFEGFLPARQAARRELLRKLRFEARTLVFFEAPHRVVSVIQDMAMILGGDRRVSLGRELTKKFEQVWNGTLDAASDSLDSDVIPARGEFVIVVEPASELSEDFDPRMLMEILLAEFPPRKAADVASQITGRSKKSLYDVALTLKKKS